MSITNVWPLFLFILVPVIVLLYILKQRGTDEIVGSTMLWQETMKHTQANTPWEKYRHHILMYLQIATVILLALCLMAPYLKQGGNDFVQAIIVLDDSASMNAVYDGDLTRFEEAKQRAADYIDSLNENCSITLITTTNSGEIAASNVSNKQQAKAYLADISCTELAGTASDCETMVQAVCLECENPGITIFTDAPVTLGDFDATVVNLSTEGENMAVNYVSYSVNEDQTLTVLAKISNFGKADGTREINLYGDDKLLDIQTVTVPASDSAIVYFEHIKFDGTYLLAEINEEDLLPNDNAGGIVLNADGTKRVLVVTAGNTFLEKALSTVAGIDLYKTTDLSVIDKNETFDLYIFDDVTPETLPEQGNLIFFNPDACEHVDVTGTKDSVKLSFAASDLTDYLDETSFSVISAKVFKRPVWAASFLTSGDDCCGYYGEYDARKMVVLGFDIHETDLALQADFPVLIYNLINYAAENALTEVASCITGDKITIYSRDSDADVIITLPSNEQVVMDASLSSKVFTDVKYTGLYTVSQTVGDETYQSLFYAGFPVDEESDGLKTWAASEGAVAGSDESPSGGRELRNWLIMFLLLLLFSEWIIYVREY